MKKILPDLIAVVAFALISFAYFFPADIEGRILFQHDTSAGTGAGQEAKVYKEETGKTTRWTNALFGGMPTYQISPSYDSGQPLKWTEKVYQLFLPEYVKLTFILMLGFYILLRAFGFSVWLSGLGGIIWAFSSYFFIIIAAGHIWKFITLAYIPPTIAGMVLAYRGKLLQGGLVFALFTALQIVSNHVQMTYYFLFVMLFMAIAFFVEAKRKGQLGQFAKATGVLVLAGLIGISVNLSNLYHTYTYSKETMRGKSELVQTGDAAKQTSSGLDRDYITQWSYGIGETLTFLVPNIKGGASVPLNQSSTAMAKANPQYSSLYGSLTQYFGDQPMTSGPVYVGAFVLFLFFLGCFIVKGPMKWALVAATIFSIVLSWGKNFMPVTDFFIDYVPMYSSFRTVSSILVIAEFTIPLLAIFALKQWLSEREALKTYRNEYLLSLALTLGIALLIWLAPGLFTDFIPAQEAQMLTQASEQGSIPKEMLGGIMANLTEMRQALVNADAWRSALVIIVGCMLLLAYSSGKLRKELTIGGVLLLCLADMWAVDKRYLYDDQFVSSSIRTDSFVKTATDEEILQDKTLDYRVLNFAGSTFNENQTSYWHKSIGGYHAAKLRRYQELIEHHIGSEMQEVYRQVAEAGGEMEQVDGSQFPVINMLNTRYFIFPIGDKGETMPIQNPYAMGNAWFVSTVNYVANANEEMAALDSFNPTRTAVVNKDFQATLHDITGAPVDSMAHLTLESYEPNHLLYTTSNKQDGVAVFSEIYYPDGWQVTIDGEKAELARANYVLRALYIPAGEHTVEMTFDPQSLHTTETMAYAGYGLLLLGVIALVWKKRKELAKSE
ncbi:MAG: YfhO family protein [Bacteroidaceae bacterium]|nr:YfhO family protein [Bacteroidaceae bacterium]